MLRKFSLTLITALVAVSLYGCKTAPKTDESETPGGAATDASDLNKGDENLMGDSDNGKALGLETVHFPYDSFVIDAAGKETLNRNIDILKTHATAKVQVEGHCDARGGIQYNIALGEKRANAVKAYLNRNGVAADRVATISYGKERLLDSSSSEEANAKNRRANFVITAK